MGMESQLSADGEDTHIFSALELTSLAIYSVELACRFFAHGISCLANAWVAFDAGLVAMGWISLFLESLGGRSNDSTDTLAPLMVMRVLRIARLARVLRLMVQFKQLWMLVRGLLRSMHTITSICVLLFIIVYVFACLGMEVITKDAKEVHWYPQEYLVLVDMYFSRLSLTMVTLVQFVTLDSVGPIVQRMVRVIPGLAIYFNTFIVIVSIALMNLITAVLVESSLQQAKQDKEMRKAHRAARMKGIFPRIERAFQELDVDNSQSLTLDEVAAAKPIVKDLLQDLVNTDNLEDLFHFLDEDDTGELSISQFCEGLAKICMEDSPLELVQIRGELRKAKANQAILSEKLDLVMDMIGSIMNKVEPMASFEAVADTERGLPMRIEERGSLMSGCA